MSMVYNTREEILQSIKNKGRSYETVEGYRLQSLTADERIALQAITRAKVKANKGVLTGQEDLLLLSRAIVDEAGQRIFDDESVKVLGELDGATFEKVLGVAEILCGYRQTTVEKFLKNFAPLEDL